MATPTKVEGIDLLIPARWNRETIADGVWLNSNTIEPIFNNDAALASAIANTSAALSSAIANSSAALIKGYVTCYKSHGDESTDIWFKLCELEPGTSKSYSYNYELAMKLICTNNGSGQCPAESASVDIGSYFIPKLNVGRCECTFSDHTVPDEERQTILGIKILTRRSSDNYGPRDKAEVWVKCSKYFTSETQMRVECLMNAGSQFYRSDYSSPTLYDLPWTFCNTITKCTHTDPFNDENHPAAQGYGAKGWSEVWYDAETKTVMVDHVQNFTDTEKENARQNIGASDGKISWKKYTEGSTEPTVEKSGISVVISDRGPSVQNDDGKLEYFMAPSPTSGDNGKVLTVDNSGVKWKEVKSVEYETTLYDMYNYQSCTKVLNQWILPTKDGRYPTRVFGNMTTTPSVNRYLSICPFSEYYKQTVWDETTESYIDNPNSPVITDGKQCHNFPNLVNNTDDCENHLYFNFYSVETNDLKVVALKGKSDESGVLTRNVSLTCVWEK